jgi:hypothetical protein
MTRGVSRNRDPNKVKMRAKYGAAYAFSRNGILTRNVRARRLGMTFDPCAKSLPCETK